jgi:hypothetical protein
MFYILHTYIQYSISNSLISTRGILLYRGDSETKRQYFNFKLLKIKFKVLLFMRGLMLDPPIAKPYHNSPSHLTPKSSLTGVFTFQVHFVDEKDRSLSPVEFHPYARDKSSFRVK